MKWVLICSVLVLAGCKTCPVLQDQLILDVDPILLVEPQPLQPLDPL